MKEGDTITTYRNSYNTTRGQSPLYKILSVAENAKQIKTNEWFVKDPTKTDSTPSVHITEKPDGTVMLKAHNGSDTRDIMRAWGLEMKDLFPPKEHPPGRPGQKDKPQIEAVYDYQDVDGKLIYQVVRQRYLDGSKTFKIRRPVNGKNDWIWNLQGVEPIPYRLPGLLQALQRGEMVLVVEGEKDVETLYKLGFTATTNHGGAGKWREAHSKHFPQDTKITIIPDNDTPGMKHGQIVAQQLMTKGCQVRIINLPGLKEHGDVSDWLQNHPYEQLQQLIAEAWDKPEEKPEPTQALMVIDTFRNTDIGNAERFVAQHKHIIRYCPQYKTWFIWDGKRWQEDIAGQIFHLARQTIRSIPHEADQYPEGDPRWAEILKWAAKSESRERLKAMVDLAQSDPAITIEPEDFDQDPWLLNVLNGALNLKTGIIQAHNPEYFINKLAPIEFKSDATCVKWLKFLDEIFHGNRGLIEYIQKISGYCLTGSTKEQDFYLLYGTGANGKSTLIRIIMDLLGRDYAKQTAATALLAKVHETPGEEIATLQGARLVCTVEVDDGKKLAESLVKQLTGGDRIRARRLYSNSFEFTPTFKLIMACNHRPGVRGTDSGIWRRIKLIPFTISIPQEQQDPDLVDKLKEEMPGILNWALAGCLKWQSEGLHPPEEVDAATTSYRVESDAMGNFLDECVVTTATAKVQAKILYEAYKAWCEKAGEYFFTMRRFNDRLRERGYRCIASTGNLKFWHGIGLIDDSLSEWGEIGHEINTS